MQLGTDEPRGELDVRHGNQHGLGDIPDANSGVILNLPATTSSIHEDKASSADALILKSGVSTNEVHSEPTQAEEASPTVAEDLSGAELEESRLESTFFVRPPEGHRLRSCHEKLTSESLKTAVEPISVSAPPESTQSTAQGHDLGVVSHAAGDDTVRVGENSSTSDPSNEHSSVNELVNRPNGGNTQHEPKGHVDAHHGAGPKDGRLLSSLQGQGQTRPSHSSGRSSLTCITTGARKNLKRKLDEEYYAFLDLPRKRRRTLPPLKSEESNKKKFVVVALNERVLSH